ncbi:hypothetical protein F511_14732 [Dorcoceras hygrometricum]|uniref:DUF7950 domain-containing protein n=1 Tax=Dorcoceras hygrometricum TaxID=472368 RepID=A0A2Z7AZJ4_9LAMI|nr:hypothetical protein F511_14732 [Dorcoceras hygrometricum]
MDGRGGCCIARYAGGGYDVVSKVDRIMLRFRPIAPKPASAGGFVSAGVVPESSQRSDGSSSSGRKKRRSLKDGEGNSRVTKRCGGRKKRILPEVAAFGGGEAGVKTLPLLPETPVLKETVGVDGLRLRAVNDVGATRVVITDKAMDDAVVPEPAPGRRAVAESWVRVERVTDRWVLDSYGYDVILGRTDVEKVMSLELDTCPGFVSDCLNNVRWINAAYRRMVAGEAEDDVLVRVVVEDGVALPAEWAAFTCRVRVVTCGKDKSSSTLPCDVWRMDCGGFAWRLDTKAALSLGW